MGLVGYILGRKKSPREIIERKQDIEHAYVKLPRRELIDISVKPGKGYVTLDTDKIRRALEKAGKKRYATLHTHITGKSEDVMAIPSYKDLLFFMEDRNSKTMFVAQQDEKTGEVRGYSCLRKTKKTKKYSEKIKSDIRVYGFGLRPKYAIPTLKGFCEKYHLQFRPMPAKGYKWSEGRGRFVKKKNLEARVAAAAAILFVVVTFFLSSNITGSMVTSLNNTSSGFLINFVLVCILGLVCYLYLK